MSYFSIIVPTFNRANMVKKTVQSLLAQSWSDMEIIVVDDGGADNTKELLNQLGDSRLKYFWKENGERGAARNYGVSKASGQYVNFFDSDDIALPNHLQEAVELIQKKDKPAFFHLGYAWADEKEKIFKYPPSYKSETLNDVIFKRNSLSCNGVFLRKDIVYAFPFSTDRNFIFMEDYLLWLKISLSHPLYYSNNPTSLIIEHSHRSIKKFDDKIYRYSCNAFLQELELLAREKSIDKSKYTATRCFANLSMAYIYSSNRSYKLQSIRHIFAALYVNLFCGMESSLLWVSLKNILIKWKA